ncbi:MAG: hypothetical protein V4474_03200 [Patescibacteria group bacterium]
MSPSQSLPIEPRRDTSAIAIALLLLAVFLIAAGGTLSCFVGPWALVVSAIGGVLVIVGSNFA